MLGTNKKNSLPPLICSCAFAYCQPVEIESFTGICVLFTCTFKSIFYCYFCICLAVVNNLGLYFYSYGWQYFYIDRVFMGNLYTRIFHLFLYQGRQLLWRVCTFSPSKKGVYSFRKDLAAQGANSSHQEQTLLKRGKNK